MFWIIACENLAAVALYYVFLLLLRAFKNGARAFHIALPLKGTKLPLKGTKTATKGDQTATKGDQKRIKRESPVSGY
jgi:hypothetical protein